MSTRPELILAIDTSGGGAGVVLSGHGRTRSLLLPLRESGYSHTEELSATVASLLASHGRCPADITLLGAVVGPGSYTGLRSGLAFLRGLAFGGNLPAVAVGTLEFLAWREAQPGESVLCACPAGAGRTAMAAYRREQDDVVELSGPALMDDEACAAALAAGASRYATLILPAAPTATTLAASAGHAGVPVRVAGPDALAKLATLVAARCRCGETTSVEKMLPAYVGQSTALPNARRVAVLGTPE